MLRSIELHKHYEKCARLAKDLKTETNKIVHIIYTDRFVFRIKNKLKGRTPKIRELFNVT